jgi:hypothetical protein
LNEELAAKLASAAARKARREERRIANAALKGETVAGTAPPSLEQPSERPRYAKRGKSQIRTAKRKKRKVPARKRAFLRLKAACKAYVFARNLDLNAGMCEIAIACGGAEKADTWYHGWPQKGGNGLKYEVRSHFHSCGRCNMGEYGARYRGTPEYRNRHRKLLGDALHDELDALHGRKQISTAEALALAEKLEAQTKAMAWRNNGSWL